ncbi:MAG: zinc ABC transporter substrate-binding protein, partial [Chloroflexota bacterium]|nr:zinc ABC transporter substrate-binding protein [Chloroflexota bacterium]
VATLPVERRKLVTNHDALSYFADRYGFEVVGTVIPSLDTRAEVSARDVAGLVELIDREGVPAIFAENTSSPGLAQELATQAGVAIIDDLYTDSLGEPGSGAETYIGLMQTDTVLIVEALR